MELLVLIIGIVLFVIGIFLQQFEGFGNSNVEDTEIKEQLYHWAGKPDEADYKEKVLDWGYFIGKVVFMVGLALIVMGVLLLSTDF